MSTGKILVIVGACVGGVLLLGYFVLTRWPATPAASSSSSTWAQLGSFVGGLGKGWLAGGGSKSANPSGNYNYGNEGAVTWGGWPQTYPLDGGQPSGVVTHPADQYVSTPYTSGVAPGEVVGDSMWTGSEWLPAGSP